MRDITAKPSIIDWVRLLTSRTTGIAYTTGTIWGDGHIQEWVVNLMNKLATITITMGRHSAMNIVVMNAQLMCTPLHACTSSTRVATIERVANLPAHLHGHWLCGNRHLKQRFDTDNFGQRVNSKYIQVRTGEDLILSDISSPYRGSSCSNIPSTAGEPKDGTALELPIKRLIFQCLKRSTWALSSVPWWQ